VDIPMCILQMGCECTFIILCQFKTTVILHHAVSAVRKVNFSHNMTWRHTGKGESIAPLLLELGCMEMSDKSQVPTTLPQEERVLGIHCDQGGNLFSFIFRCD